MLVYPSGLNVSTQTLTFVTQKLRAHRKANGTRWRVLYSHRQTLMLLAYLRKGETYRDLAVGFGVGTTTAYRYLREALNVLAALAPTLQEAMQVAAAKAYVTLDGTSVPPDPLRQDDAEVRPHRAFAGQKAVNQAHSAIRAPGERANAELKNWRILRKIRPHHQPHQCRSGTHPSELMQVVGSGTGAVTPWCSVFQPPPVEPCMRFSRTRLTDVVHRRHSVSPARAFLPWVRRRSRKGETVRTRSGCGPEAPSPRSGGCVDVDD